MNQIASSNCTRCSENCDQTPLHMFYDCNYVKPLFLWLLRVLLDICNFKPHSNIKFLYFDNFYSNSYKRNICNMFLYIYIVTVWKTRKENLRIGILRHMIVRKVSANFVLIKHMPNQSLEKVFGTLSSLDIDNLIRL